MVKPSSLENDAQVETSDPFLKDEAYMEEFDEKLKHPEPICLE